MTPPLTTALNGTLRSLAMPHPMRSHQPHALHQGDRVWQETNCYVDLWIELLHGFGLDPRAAFAFTVTQDFEGDQFTFFKFPLEDLERLYGTQVQELAIYDSLEDRVLAQTLRGHTVLVEVDGYYLPNTRATSYRREHPKTTVGIDFIDPAALRLGYFHNTGYHLLEGEDYEGVFRKLPQFSEQADLLFPYVEFAKQVRPALEGIALAEASAELLCTHLARRPMRNPITQWRAEFPQQLDTLLARGKRRQGLVVSVFKDIEAVVAQIVAAARHGPHEAELHHHRLRGDLLRRARNLRRNVEALHGQPEQVLRQELEVRAQLPHQVK
jgi:hypothetical protein